MFRVEHVWRLEKYKDDIPCWICERCGSFVHTTAKQREFNSFRKPNPRRKFDNKFCGEILVSKVHDS